MSLQERFTEDEIFLLSNTPTMIGTVMSFAEGSGLGTVKELLASSKTLIGGIKKYPDNAIITGVLPMSKTKEMRQKSISRLKERQIISSDMLFDQLIEDAKKVSGILSEKATDKEATEYKEWAMSVAENVAKAAKEGGFLGMGGTRISDSEIKAFEQIAVALGTTTLLRASLLIQKGK